MTRICALLLAAALTAAEIPAPWRAAIEKVRADSLKGHVSFLASDLLEGRGTPSRGLEIAAEYIAAQLRRAGIEPAAAGSYFQQSPWLTLEPNREGFVLTLEAGGSTIAVPAQEVDILTGDAIALENAPVHLQKPGEALPANLEGKVLVARRGLQTATDALERRALAVLMLDTRPNARPAPKLARADTRQLTALTVRGAAAAKLADLESISTITIKSAAAHRQEIKLRNVVGVLRGSDPVLRETYVLVSAHYDHVGIRGTGVDRVYNGANDDASGVAAMLEAAAALAAVEPRPKRSIVFLATFGEELGLLGSFYYADHPVFPLAKTIGALSLEVLGRFDGADGPHEGRLAMTGHGYSTVTGTLTAAGEQTGVTVYRHETNSDAFFTRSDNAPLAAKGVPAHTVSTGFLFPDYHQPGDEWEKLDYVQMQKAARTVTLGLLMLADSPTAPEWNAENPRTERFREAARKLREP